MSLNELILNSYKPGLSIRVDGLTVDGTVKFGSFTGNVVTPLGALPLSPSTVGSPTLLATGQTQSTDTNGSFTRIGKIVTLTLPTFALIPAKQNTDGGRIVITGLPAAAAAAVPTQFPCYVVAGAIGSTETTGTVTGTVRVEGTSLIFWQTPGRANFTYSASNPSGLSAITAISYIGV